MLSFPNFYARRILNKRKLDCNHLFAITVMHQYSDYKIRVYLQNGDINVYVQGISKKVTPKIKLLPFSQFLSKFNETM